jgi:hypothetical protein
LYPNSFKEPYTPLLLGDVLASQVKIAGGHRLLFFLFIFADFLDLPLVGCLINME